MLSKTQIFLSKTQIYIHTQDSLSPRGPHYHFYRGSYCSILGAIVVVFLITLITSYKVNQNLSKLIRYYLLSSVLFLNSHRYLCETFFCVYRVEVVTLEVI